MMFLCAIFISPLYFLIRGRWGGFVINAFFYGLAWLFLLSVFFAIVAPLFWVIAFTHAAWGIRKEMAEEHAEMLATKMAQKMNLK